MNFNYVSLSEAKTHLRVIDDTEDSKILLYCQSASAMVKNYLGDASVYQVERNDDEDQERDSNYWGIVIEEDTNTETIERSVRPEVKVAVLLLVQEIYEQEYTFGNGELPMHVKSILYPLRDPALA